MKKWIIVGMMVFAGSVHAELSLEHLSEKQKARLMVNMAEDFAHCSAITTIWAHCINNTEPGAGDQWENIGNAFLATGSMYHHMSIAVTDPAADIDKSRKAFYMKMQNHATEINAETGSCANYYSMHKDTIQECVAMPEDVEAHITQWLNELDYPLTP